MSVIEAVRAEWTEAARMAKAPALEARAAPDETRLVERADEGAAVRHFLESRFVQEFMAKAEANLTNEMLGLALGDNDGRRNLAIGVQTIRQLRKYLTTLAADGKAAERELARLRSGKREFF